MSEPRTWLDGIPAEHLTDHCTAVEAEFLELATGDLDQTVAFMTGKLWAEGDRASALAPSGAVRVPTAGG